MSSVSLVQQRDERDAGLARRENAERRVEIHLEHPLDQRVQTGAARDAGAQRLLIRARIEARALRVGARRDAAADLSVGGDHGEEAQLEHVAAQAEAELDAELAVLPYEDIAEDAAEELGEVLFVMKLHVAEREPRVAVEPEVVPAELEHLAVVLEHPAVAEWVAGLHHEAGLNLEAEVVA